MPKLILIKHSQPEIAANTPSPRWVLSDEGRQRCDWLGDQLGVRGVTRLYSSLEPKALETAALAALAAVKAGLTVKPMRNLHENDRTGMGFATSDEFERRIRLFFDRPGEIIMGEETADAAFQRFSTAVQSVLADAAGESAAIVTHGTVLSLFVSRHNAIDVFGLWASLGLPSFVALDGATMAFGGEVHKMGGGGR